MSIAYFRIAGDMFGPWQNLAGPFNSWIAALDKNIAIEVDWAGKGMVLASDAASEISAALPRARGLPRNAVCGMRNPDSWHISFALAAGPALCLSTYT